MAAGSIVVDLLLKTASFETDTKRASRAAQRSAKEIQRAYADAADHVNGAFKTLFAGLSVAALVQFAKSTLQGVDAMNDLADATGASVENISALDDVARRTGTNLDNVGAILVKFNAALKEGGDPTKGPGAVLKALGLDVERLKKLDPAEALRQTAVALSRFADDGDKARAVQELFGKSIREAGPYLKDLAEQGQLNATVTKRQAEETEAFNKLVFGLQADIVGLARTIVGDLIPSVSGLIKELTAGTKAFGGFWEALLSIGTSNPFGSQLEKLAKYEAQFKQTQKNIAETEAIANKSFLGDQDARLAALRAQSAEALKFLNYQRGLLGITDGSAGGGRGFVNPTPAQQKLAIPPDLKIGGAKAAKIEIDQVAKAMAALEEELALFGQNESFKKAFKLEGLGATTQQVEEYRQSLARLEELQTAAAIEEAIAALVKERDELGLTNEQLSIQKLVLQGASEEQIRYAQSVIGATAAAREQAAAQEEGKRLYEQTRTPAEQLNIELGKLNGLLQKGAIDWDTYARAVFQAQDRFDDSTKKTIEVADSFAKKFAENAQDVLGQGLYDMMTGNFKNIGDAFAQMLTRMVAEAAAAELSRSLFGDLLKGGSGKGFLGDILGGIGSWFGGPKAGGGEVGTDRAYLVGEQGPEMFVPRTSGTIIPAAATAGMRGGGDTNHYHIAVNSNGAMDRAAEERAAARIARSVGERQRRRSA